MVDIDLSVKHTVENVEITASWSSFFNEVQLPIV